MADPALESALAAGPCEVGQVRISIQGDGYLLCHRDDSTRPNLRAYDAVDVATSLVRFDDAGRYRPLKTAPNLRHGWSLSVMNLEDVRQAIEAFYPGRLAVLAAFKADRLEETPLRQTLNRQTGMYRVAADISDEQIDRVAGQVCQSEGGCLRTILWRKNAAGDFPSKCLHSAKFDPRQNQIAAGSSNFIPLLCQEACAVLVEACRRAVKSAGPNEL